MTRTAKIALVAPLAIAGMALFAALGGQIVKLLWNALVPALFGWPAITFWQALGLLVLCRILFGGFGMSGRRHHGMGSRIRARWNERFSERVVERMEQMTPEERERFRDRIRDQFGA